MENKVEQEMEKNRSAHKEQALPEEDGRKLEGSVEVSVEGREDGAKGGKGRDGKSEENVEIVADETSRSAEHQAKDQEKEKALPEEDVRKLEGSVEGSVEGREHGAKGGKGRAEKSEENVEIVAAETSRSAEHQGKDQEKEELSVARSSVFESQYGPYFNLETLEPLGKPFPKGMRLQGLEGGLWYFCKVTRCIEDEDGGWLVQVQWEREWSIYNSDQFRMSIFRPEILEKVASPKKKSLGKSGDTACTMKTRPRRSGADESWINALKKVSIAALVIVGGLEWLVMQNDKSQQRMKLIRGKKKGENGSKENFVTVTVRYESISMVVHKDSLQRKCYNAKEIVGLQQSQNLFDRSNLGKNVVAEFAKTPNDKIVAEVVKSKLKLKKADEEPEDENVETDASSDAAPLVQSESFVNLDSGSVSLDGQKEMENVLSDEGTGKLVIDEQVTANLDTAETKEHSADRETGKSDDAEFVPEQESDLVDKEDASEYTVTLVEKQVEQKERRGRGRGRGRQKSKLCGTGVGTRGGGTIGVATIGGCSRGGGMRGGISRGRGGGTIGGGKRVRSKTTYQEPMIENQEKSDENGSGDEVLGNEEECDTVPQSKEEEVDSYQKKKGKLKPGDKVKETITVKGFQLDHSKWNEMKGTMENVESEMRNKGLQIADMKNDIMSKLETIEKKFSTNLEQSVANAFSEGCVVRVEQDDLNRMVQAADSVQSGLDKVTGEVQQLFSGVAEEREIAETAVKELITNSDGVLSHVDEQSKQVFDETASLLKATQESHSGTKKATLELQAACKRSEVITKSYFGTVLEKVQEGIKTSAEEGAIAHQFKRMADNVENTLKVVGSKFEQIAVNNAGLKTAMGNLAASNENMMKKLEEVLQILQKFCETAVSVVAECKKDVEAGEAPKEHSFTIQDVQAPDISLRSIASIEKELERSGSALRVLNVDEEAADPVLQALRQEIEQTKQLPVMAREESIMTDVSGEERSAGPAEESFLSPVSEKSIQELPVSSLDFMGKPVDGDVFTTDKKSEESGSVDSASSVAAGKGACGKVGKGKGRKNIGRGKGTSHKGSPEKPVRGDRQVIVELRKVDLAEKQPGVSASLKKKLKTQSQEKDEESSSPPLKGATAWREDETAGGTMMKCLSFAPDLKLNVHCTPRLEYVLEEPPEAPHISLKHIPVYYYGQIRGKPRVTKKDSKKFCTLDLLNNRPVVQLPLTKEEEWKGNEGSHYIPYKDDPIKLNDRILFYSAERIDEVHAGIAGFSRKVHLAEPATAQFENTEKMGREDGSRVTSLLASKLTSIGFNYMAMDVLTPTVVHRLTTESIFNTNPLIITEAIRIVMLHRCNSFPKLADCELYLKTVLTHIGKYISQRRIKTSLKGLGLHRDPDAEKNRVKTFENIQQMIAGGMWHPKKVLPAKAATESICSVSSEDAAVELGTFRTSEEVMKEKRKFESETLDNESLKKRFKESKMKKKGEVVEPESDFVPPKKVGPRIIKMKPRKPKIRTPLLAKEAHKFKTPPKVTKTPNPLKDTKVTKPPKVAVVPKAVNFGSDGKLKETGSKLQDEGAEGIKEAEGIKVTGGAVGPPALGKEGTEGAPGSSGKVAATPSPKITYPEYILNQRDKLKTFWEDHAGEAVTPELMQLFTNMRDKLMKDKKEHEDLMKTIKELDGESQ